MNLPEMTEPVYYAEERCSLRWPLVFHGLFWPLLLIASYTAVLVTDNYAFLPGAILGIFGCPSFGGMHLAQDWPIGIRVDAAGIWIGGIRRAERLRARRQAQGHHIRTRGKLPRARARRRQVFFCPWDAVQRVAVVTDRKEIRKIAKLGAGVGASLLSAGTGTIRLGPLTAPYTRAALVLDVDLAAASVPEFRPPDTRRYWFKTSAPQRFVSLPVWSAPTRHPEKLHAALARLDFRGAARK
jgi:hypothetical protein